MKLGSKQEGHLIIFTAMLIFGLNIPVTKYLYNQGVITPMAVTLLRMAFATCAFWILSLFFPKEKLNKKDLLTLLLAGIMGMAINQGCFAYGLSKTSPVDASIIATNAPLFTMIIAAVVLKEPITLKKAGGVVIAGLGAILLVYTSSYVSNNTASWQGNISILCAQFFYSIYLVITKPLADRYSFVTMMKWMFLMAMIVMFPLGIKDVIEAPIFIGNSIYPLLALFFILFGATFIAYALIPLAQRRIRPTTISVYNNMQPVIASAVAMGLGMDTFTLEKAVSAALIVLGVYFVTMSKSKADIEKEVLTDKV